MESLKYEKMYNGLNNPLTHHCLKHNNNFIEVRYWLFNFACYLRTGIDITDLSKWLSNVKTQILLAKSVQLYFDSDLSVNVTATQLKESAVIYLYIWNCLCYSYGIIMEEYNKIRKQIEKPLHDDQVTEKILKIYEKLDAYDSLQKQYVKLIQVLIHIGSFHCSEIQNDSKFKAEEYDTQKLMDMVYDLCMLIANKYDEEYIFGELEKLKKIGPNNNDEDDDEDTECPICFRDYVNKTTLNCTHSFCRECIDDWQNGSSSERHLCPMCKQKIMYGDKSNIKKSVEVDKDQYIKQFKKFIESNVEKANNESDSLLDPTSIMLLKNLFNNLPDAKPSTYNPNSETHHLTQPTYVPSFYGEYKHYNIPQPSHQYIPNNYKTEYPLTSQNKSGNIYFKKYNTSNANNNNTKATNTDTKVTNCFPKIGKNDFKFKVGNNYTKATNTDTKITNSYPKIDNNDFKFEVGNNYTKSTNTDTKVTNTKTINTDTKASNNDTKVANYDFKVKYDYKIDNDTKDGDDKYIMLPVSSLLSDNSNNDGKKKPEIYIYCSDVSEEKPEIKLISPFPKPQPKIDKPIAPLMDAIDNSSKSRKDKRKEKKLLKKEHSKSCDKKECNIM